MTVDRPWSRIGAWLRQLVLPAPVVRIGIFFLAEDAPAVVSVLGRLGVCHLERSPQEFKDFLTPFFPPEYQEAFRRLHEHHDALAQRWRQRRVADLTCARQQVPTTAEMERCCQALAAVREQVQALDQQARTTRQRRTELEQFAYYVRALAELRIDVPALAELRFLHCRAGIVPTENFQRLQESAALGEDLVLRLGAQGEHTHCLVVGAGGISPDLEGLLAKAHFQPTSVPLSLEGASAQTLQTRVRAEIQRASAECAELESREQDLREQAQDDLKHAAAVLAHASVLVQCAGALQARLPVALLIGWIVPERLAELEQVLAQEVASPVAIVHQPLADDSEEQPPSPLQVPPLFRPGASLVTLFGTPGTDEINPSLVLAATTPLFFGMMFGDLGQGLLLALLAVVFRRRLGIWVAPALACSLSSAFFGLLYGSVFGVEHWLPAWWLQPMKEPFRLLATALTVGIGFLLLTFILKAINLALRHRWQEALFGFAGGGGLLCYLGGVLGLRAFYLDQPMPMLALSLLAAGLLATGWHMALEVRTHGSGALGLLLTEFFHGALGLVTNTLSFLRLAAFALNHAALSMALFLVLDMLPGSTLGWLLRGVLFVLGSIVILVVDVLVVAVQTIRLEFYEGLTRYFRGEGRAFVPLRFPESRVQ